jgi:hypothetical protein
MCSDEVDAATTVRCSQSQHALCAACALNCIGAWVTPVSKFVAMHAPFAFSFPCSGDACAFTTCAFMQGGTGHVREAFLHAHAVVAVARQGVAAVAPSRSTVHGDFVAFWRPRATAAGELNEWVRARGLAARLHDALCRRCPECHAVFDAFDGCNALTCAACHVAFCAICAQPCGLDAHAHVVAFHKELYTRSDAQRAEHARNFKVTQVARVLREELRHPVLAWAVLQQAHRDLRDNGITLADLCVFQRLPRYAFAHAADAESARAFLASAVTDGAGISMLMVVAPALDGLFDTMLHALETRGHDVMEDVMLCARNALSHAGVPQRFCSETQWLRLAHAFARVASGALAVRAPYAYNDTVCSSFAFFIMTWHQSVRKHMTSVRVVSPDVHARMCAFFLDAEHAQALLQLCVHVCECVTQHAGQAFFDELLLHVDFAWRGELMLLVFSRCVQRVRETAVPMLELALLPRLDDSWSRNSLRVHASDAHAVLKAALNVILTTERNALMSSTQREDVVNGALLLILHAMSTQPDETHDVAAKLRHVQQAEAHGLSARSVRACVRCCMIETARAAVHVLSQVYACPYDTGAFEVVAIAVRRADGAVLSPIGPFVEVDDERITGTMHIAARIAYRVTDLLRMRADGSHPVLEFVRVLRGAPHHETGVVNLVLALPNNLFNDARFTRAAWYATLFDTELRVYRAAAWPAVGPMQLPSARALLLRAYRDVCDAPHADACERACTIHARYALVIGILRRAESVEEAVPVPRANAETRGEAAYVARRAWCVVIDTSSPRSLPATEALLHLVASAAAAAGDVFEHDAPVHARVLARLCQLQTKTPAAHALLLAVAARMHALDVGAWAHVLVVLRDFSAAPHVHAQHDLRELMALCALEAAHALLTRGAATSDAQADMRACASLLRSTVIARTERNALFVGVWHATVPELVARLPDVPDTPLECLTAARNTELTCTYEMRVWTQRVGARSMGWPEQALSALDALLRDDSVWCDRSVCEWLVAHTFHIETFATNAWVRVVHRVYDGVWHALPDADALLRAVWTHWAPAGVITFHALYACAAMREFAAESPLLHALLRVSQLTLASAADVLLALQDGAPDLPGALVRMLLEQPRAQEDMILRNRGTALATSHVKALVGLTWKALQRGDDATGTLLLHTLARILCVSRKHVARAPCVFFDARADAQILLRSDPSAVARVLLVGLWAAHPSGSQSNVQVRMRTAFVAHTVAMPWSAADAAALPDELFEVLGAARTDAMPAWVAAYVPHRNKRPAEHAESSASKRIGT